MFASPPLCHFRKTRTQYLSGRTENHRTLVGIVGFRAGMKYKTFRICTQHHSMSTCQPHNHLCNRFLPLQACSHTTHLPPRPSYSKCTLLPSIPPFCSESTVSPPRQLEYYDVAWGLTKVLQKEKVLAAVSRLRHRYLVEVHNLNVRATFRGVKTVLWPFYS